VFARGLGWAPLRSGLSDEGINVFVSVGITALRSVWCLTTQCMSKICAGVEGMSTKLSWNAIDKAKLKYSEKSLFLCQFLHHNSLTDLKWTCVMARPNAGRQLTLLRWSKFYAYVIRYVVPEISSATSHYRFLVFGRHAIFCWNENQDFQSK
jgi:hypothetical protein